MTTAMSTGMHVGIQVQWSLKSFVVSENDKSRTLFFKVINIKFDSNLRFLQTLRAYLRGELFY
jgi:hypothetical protein